MLKKELSKAEFLVKNIERVRMFESKYGIIPVEEIKTILKEIRSLDNSILPIDFPENEDEVIQAELKRRLSGESLILEQTIFPPEHDLAKILSIYGVPEEDILCLREWLISNKEDTLKAIERMYQTRGVENYELGLPLDIPSIKRGSEEFSEVHVKKYHKVLGKLLQDLTSVGEYLREIDAVSTLDERSYFHSISKTLAVSIPTICSVTKDMNLRINEKELIRIYGHEGMGHALNHTFTLSSKLPYLLTNCGSSTLSTLESVAQFYEKVIFEDLKNSPETQKELGIRDIFEDIYQESKDLEKMRAYKSKLNYYAIVTLADKSLGKPSESDTWIKKEKLLGEVALSTDYPNRVINSLRNNIDYNGNLHPNLIKELIYCAQPVKRALEEFSKRGIFYSGEDRSVIDETLLRGYWTPLGYIENARLKAQE